MSYSKVYKAESDLTSKKKISGIQIALYVFLILICLTYILPLLWVLNVSFKTHKEIFSKTEKLEDLDKLAEEQDKKDE